MQTANEQHLHQERRREENEAFRLAIDHCNVFHISNDELAELIEDAPTPEAKAWLRGISEARTYFAILQPTILH